MIPHYELSLPTTGGMRLRSVEPGVRALSEDVDSDAAEARNQLGDQIGRKLETFGEVSTAS
jgi:hypothetical protein